MTHHEIESLLGVYALDATSPQERTQVEAHLASCPRCRAEVTVHQETAAVMATGIGGTSPDGLWERIAAATFAGRPDGEAALAFRPAPIAATRRGKRFGPPAAGGARRLAVGFAAAATCALLALASYLGLQVAHLRTQVHALGQQVASASLGAAAASAAAGPHVMVALASTQGPAQATVVVAPSGVAYWLPSRLPALTPHRTYQLWGLVGHKVVSLGLIGPDPRSTSRFRVEAGTTKLMVTDEPSGGVPVPTTSVLVAGVVPASAVS